MDSEIYTNYKATMQPKPDDWQDLNKPVPGGPMDTMEPQVEDRIVLALKALYPQRIGRHEYEKVVTLIRMFEGE